MAATVVAVADATVVVVAPATVVVDPNVFFDGSFRAFAVANVVEDAAVVDAVAAVTVVVALAAEAAEDGGGNL